jgi:hypothetical protein
LQGAGYVVDYYGPSQVTVGLFRDLPAKGYGLVIIRAHAASRGPTLSIFTSELYSSSSYVYEQLTDQLVPATFQSGAYFAVTPRFVQGGMHGNFPHTAIIMMGCSGLAGSDMAKAFIERGASAYIGWDGLVTAGHTDASTLALLQSLGDGKSLKEATGLAAAQPGRDPQFSSGLDYYDSITGITQDSQNILSGLGELSIIIALAAVAPALVVLLPKLFGRL